jgi:hypothetical protein
VVRYFVSQIVCRAGVEWAAWAVIFVLEYCSQSIRCLYKNKNDYSVWFYKSPLRIVRLSYSYILDSKSVGTISFTRKIEVHWPSRLVVRLIKEVSLLECSLFVRIISCTVWEMNYLDIPVRRRGLGGYIASKLGNHILYVIVFQKRRETVSERNERKITFKNRTHACTWGCRF